MQASHTVQCTGNKLLLSKVQEGFMKRTIQIVAALAVLGASATTASAYRIEKVEAYSKYRGNHYLYSCICDNGTRMIAYSTTPIRGDDCLTACDHAGS